MVAEKFHICGVKITGKYICESKMLNLFIFTHVSKKSYLRGSYHYNPGRRKLPILPPTAFSEGLFFSSRKGWRIMELKK